MAPWGRTGDDVHMLYTGGTTGMPKGVMWRQDDLFARLNGGGFRRYAEADLVICRAGAVTVAELSAGGMASVLVPFPHAVDDHQTANARFLADHGAAVLLPQPELTPDKLASLIGALDRGRLLEMATKARALGKRDAASVVARRCIELAEARK